MNDTTPSQPRAYFAFRSPYSRLGLHKLKRAGFEGELFVFTGPPEDVPFSDPMANPHKMAYYQHDVFRMTLRMGLPLALPDPFDPDYQPSCLAFVAADRDGKGLDFALAISDARWGEGKNISQPDVIEAAARSADWSGYDPSCLTDEGLKQTLRDQRAQIAADGVFGVPFLIDGSEKYWGQDRFDLWAEDKAKSAG